jgi:hypothetical protein
MSNVLLNSNTSMNPFQNQNKPLLLVPPLQPILEIKEEEIEKENNQLFISVSELNIEGDVIPSPRWGHTCIQYKNGMFIFGGWDSKPLNDFFFF